MTSTKESPPQLSLAELLGPKLLLNAKGAKRDTKTALKNKDLILLYFSASWCPPCKTFSPILMDFYNETAKDHNLEIIYVSSDRTVADFTEYYGKMPWLAIPSDEGAAAIKSVLADKLKISAIPTLVVLDGDGKYITNNAREAVGAAAAFEEKRNQLIQWWKNKEAVPLDQADLGGGSWFSGGIGGILMAIMKNPTYIFGLLYLFKMAKTFFQEHFATAAVEADKEL
jgi:nucleoredoxin